MPQFIEPEQLQLTNGIPVILQHYDGPVAATYWWVRTGSADEEPAEAGFAHFLEHMLFKDAAAKETGRASTGQMARAIESLGGDINAYTSFDQTVYHVTCAAHHWERVLAAFGSMAKPQRFLREDFEREREVILEELRKNEDSPGRQMFQGLFSTTFRRHPYGRPVIGFVKTLKSAKVGELESFYRRNYVPAKMGLVLVGPLRDKTGARRRGILKYLEKHYGARVLPKRPAKFRVRAPEPELRPQPAIAVRPFDVKTPTVSYSFRVPALTHSDTPALDVLSGILGMGELSRLYQRLFYQTSLATDVSGGLYVPRDPGMLYFQAELDAAGKIRQATEEVFRELRRLAEEGPAPEELARVVVNAESERLYATQTADGMAGRLGFLRYILGDLAFDSRYLDDLRAVDAAKVKEVARKYLDYRRMSGALLLPKGEAEKYETRELAELARHELRPEKLVAPKLVSTRAAKQRARPESSTELPIELMTLPSGMKLAYFERPQSHVVSVHAAVMGGVRLELAHPVNRPETDWGSGYMMSLTWTKGTAKRGAREIARVAEGHAAGIDGFSGRNSAGVQMTGLARDWGTLSELFTDVLLEPVFPEDEVAHSRRIAEDAVRGIEDHSSQLCSKLFLETLFEKHPYGRLTTGSLESLAKIDSAKLRAFHGEWVRPERLVVAVSGAVPRSSLETWLEDLDRRAREQVRGAAGERVGASGAGGLEDEPELRAPRWVEKSLGREQCHIIVGGLGLRITDEDRFTLRLLQTLLGGQSGRLFIELREKRSLAYTVSPVSFEGIERGYVGTYIACAPQKREEAVAGIREVHARLAAKGPSAVEMSRAKEFFLGRRAMDLQSDSAIASHYGLETLYGVRHLSEDELARKIRGISPRDVQRVCRRYLVDPYMVTSVVG